MKFRSITLTVATGVMLAVASLAIPQASATEDDAKQIFKAMSDYLASQKTISVTFDSGVEVITPAMEKIQFASSGTLLLRTQLAQPAASNSNLS